MERLTETDVIAINKLLEYAAIARSNGRRCNVEMHFNEEERAIALKLDLGGPGACYAVAYEPSIPEAVDRVLTQADAADARDSGDTDPVPGPLPSELPDVYECIA